MWPEGTGCEINSAKGRSATRKRPRVFLGCSIGQLPGCGGKLGQETANCILLTLAIKLRATKPQTLPTPSRRAMAGESKCAGAIGCKNHQKPSPTKPKGYKRAPQKARTSAKNSLKTPKSRKSHSSLLNKSLFDRYRRSLYIGSPSYKPLVGAVRYIENSNCSPHVSWGLVLV